MQAPSIVLTREQRERLEQIEHAGTSEQRQVLRARVVLRAAEDLANLEIATQLRTGRKTVGKWRARFARQGERGLLDAPRSGRPAKTGAVTRCQIISVACSLGRQVEDSKPETLRQELDALIVTLADQGALDHGEREQVSAAADTLYHAARRVRGPKAEEAPARTRWTLATLSQAIAEAEIAELSTSSLWRILNQSELKPHRQKMWLHSPDPDFKRKVTEICELYLHPPEDASVVCVDEKTSMQILRRIHPGRPALPGRLAREEFEYQRQGTLCLFAGFEVQTGQVFGRLREARTAWDTRRFMEELASWRPNREIHIVWDNLNTHAEPQWQDFNRAHGGRFHFHYTPIHASWVNQVECFFSIFTRRVLEHASFSSQEDFVWKARTFLARWNQDEAQPFRWKFGGYPSQAELAHPRAA
jgi:transposase